MKLSNSFLTGIQFERSVGKSISQPPQQAVVTRVIDGDTIELVKAGLAKVSVYEKRRPLVYQYRLLSAQEVAKNSGLLLWQTDQ